MGIFSRRPNIPDPTVSCSWTNTPNGPYRPGSIVSGTIAFTCPASRQVRLATTSFHGHCITHNTRTVRSGPNNQTRTIHYHDDVELFRYDQDVPSSRGLTLGGLAAVENEQYGFDFGFNFPSTTGNLQGEDFYTRSTAGSDAYDVGQHDLPPSYGLNYSDSKVADVVYRIEAAFLLDDNPEPFIVQFDPLSFIPYPPSPPPPHASAFLEFTRKTETYSSSRLAGQEKSFRASIKDKFSSHTPSLDLTMKASLIPFLTVGQPFNLFVCVEVGRLSDPNAIRLPNVVLRVKKLKLYENTKFRALRVIRGNRQSENERMEEGRPC